MNNKELKKNLEKERKKQREDAIKINTFIRLDKSSASKYSQHWRNRQYQDSVLMRINICLGTSFTREEMMMIYQRLGNCCNHKLTMKFVSSGYDMKLLEEK